MDRLAFIGDIHGDYVRLSSLLRKLADRRKIFLGDYIDHGPASRSVIEVLTKLADHQRNNIFLSGNHEMGLIAFLAGKLSFLEYAWMGGLSTMRSYIGKASDNVRRELLAAIPQSHRDFLENCIPVFETAQVVACHAGINPASPANRELGQIVLGRHPALFDENLRIGKLVICGHYLQKTKIPFVANDVICLNTGCGTIGGPLTALLYPEMSFLQA